jgi:hypothetical protein
MNNQIKARFTEWHNTTFEKLFYHIHPKQPADPPTATRSKLHPALRLDATHTVLRWHNASFIS